MGPRYINHIWASYLKTRYSTTKPGESINFQNLPRIEGAGGDKIWKGGWGVLVSVVAYKLQPIEIRCEILTYRIVPWGKWFFIVNSVILILFAMIVFIEITGVFVFR